MRLHNVTPVNGRQPVTIRVQHHQIEDAGRPDKAGFDIDLEGAIVLPGLINSHDHLEFNCFIPLGDKIYNNYTEWGHHIHATYKVEIDKVLNIPLPLRAAWGMYKNLLAGVTTVVNHGAVLHVPQPLIHIYQQVQNLHSVSFQKKWKRQLNNPLMRRRICVIHAGEGTDRTAYHEINAIIKWNFLQRRIVAVHGVAMNTVQAKQFAGLVWCPESNRVLLNRHADIFQLKEQVKIVFGTDSTLSGDWNIWKHLRLARQLKLVNDETLFDMVTTAPAKLWKLNTASLEAGKDADIIIASPKNGNMSWDGFFSINPSDILLVLQKGNIRLFDKSLLPQVAGHIDIGRFTEFKIGNAVKMVEGDLPKLVSEIKKYHPGVQLPKEITFNNDPLYA